MYNLPKKTFVFIAEMINEEDDTDNDITSDVCKLGCGKRIDQFETTSYHHNHECPYRMVKCSNEGCNASMRARDHRIHQKVCLFRKIPCGSFGMSCSTFLHDWIAKEKDKTGYTTLCPCKKHSNHAILWAAAQRDEIELMTFFFKAVGCIRLLQFESDSGDNVLTKTFQNGNVNLLNHLVSLQVDSNDGFLRSHFEKYLNKETSRGKTCLCEAAKCNQVGIIERLEILPFHVNFDYVTKTHRLSAIEWSRKHSAKQAADKIEEILYLRKKFNELMVSIQLGSLSKIRLLIPQGERYRYNHVIRLHQELEDKIKIKEACEDSVEKYKKWLCPISIDTDKITKEMSSQIPILDNFETNIGIIRSKIEDIEIKQRTRFRFAMINFQNELSTSTLNAFLTSETCSEKILTAKALLSLFNLSENESSSIKDSQAWMDATRLLSSKTFSHQARHINLNEMLCQEKLREIQMQIESLANSDCVNDSFHTALNEWILEVCKSFETTIYLKQLRHEEKKLSTDAKEALANNEKLQNKKKCIEKTYHELKLKLSTEISRLKELTQNVAYFRGLLETAKIMSMTSATGHTLLSWAASLGMGDIIEYLLDHGAVGFGYCEEYLNCCANLIATCFRSHVRKKRQFLAQSTADILFEPHFTLLLRLSKLFRARVRVPLVEAMFNRQHNVIEAFEKKSISLFQLTVPSFVSPVPVIPFLPQANTLDANPLRIGIDIKASVWNGAALYKSQIYKENLGWINISQIHCFSCTTSKMEEVISILNANKLAALKHKEKIFQEKRMSKELMVWANKMEENIVNADFKGILGCARRGISIDFETHESVTPLMKAAMIDISVNENKASPIKFLMENAEFVPNINYLTKCQSSALSTAIIAGNASTVKALIDYGADVNLKVTDGMTPLILASRYGKLEIVNILLHNEADISIHDSFSKSSIDWANYNNHVKISALLARRLRGDVTNICPVDKKVRCRWGCGKAAFQKNIRRHENICSLRHVRCDHCGVADIPATDIDYHRNEACTKRQVKCKLCSEYFAIDSLENHIKYNCPHRNVNCVCCGQQLTARRLRDHDIHLCTHRPMQCPNDGCKQIVPLVHLNKHKVHDCIFRIVECRKCRKPMKFHERTLHEQGGCQPIRKAINEKSESICDEVEKVETLVNCKNLRLGCSWIGHEYKLDEHLSSLCHFSFIHICPNKCGLKLQKVGLSRHSKFECVRRYIRCIKCGADVMMALKPTHDKYECKSIRNYSIS